MTRAKVQIVVFSTTGPAEIRVDEMSSRGVRALQGYLQYAQTGILQASPRLGVREPDSDFEIAVARRLRETGFDVVPQVGVAGYFIDLGVRDPTKPGLFVLGIECDGATYHSAKSTRDRDRLRQEVLERHGWKLHRIWSLDWYRNPVAEAKKVVDRIHRLVRTESKS